ncbi:MAG: 30S ribosomal protein S5 [Alphaproteobacteria bacterium]|jgi:small subunit ribosomal protein S5|nr:30S ribosomal protein S5 [Candidatus Jidaibacter sp.]
MSENLEIIYKLVHVGRKTKVVKGGRRFSFAAIVIAGNQNGMVGIGTGRATEVQEANEKAKNDAMKNLAKIPLKEGRTLHHDIVAKYGAGKVVMRSAAPGTGIIAGGPIRAVCEALGVKDIVVKSLGSSNPHNMIKAALAALQSTRSPKYIAEMRGKKIGEIVSRREKASTN